MSKSTKSTRSYTICYNDMIRNTSLSLSARGLYMLIQSYINIDGFKIKKDHIRKMSGLTEHSFNKIWNELKNKGYLIQHKLQTQNGWDYIYEIDDNPVLGCDSVNSPDIDLPHVGKQHVNNYYKVKDEDNNKASPTKISKVEVVLEDLKEKFAYEKTSQYYKLIFEDKESLFDDALSHVATLIANPRPFISSGHIIEPEEVYSALNNLDHSALRHALTIFYDKRDSIQVPTQYLTKLLLTASADIKLQ